MSQAVAGQSRSRQTSEIRKHSEVVSDECSVRFAVLMDRDGVVNYERDDYVKRKSEFKFIEGALEALAELSRLGIPTALITNQSAIGRGKMSEKDLAAIHSYMTKEVKRHGGNIKAVFYCPHAPRDKCLCRKPGTLLFERAERELGISLRDSYYVGDKPSDRAAGRAAGCRPVVLKSNTPYALLAFVRSLTPRNPPKAVTCKRATLRRHS